MEERLDDVILVDEEGEQSRFAHVLTFLYEGKRYVALEPLEGEEEDAEEAEIVLMEARQENGEDVYEPIQNEILLDEVFAEFLDLIEEKEEKEE